MPLRYEQQTLNLLEKNNLKIPVIFSGHDSSKKGKNKSEICVGKKIKLMIEDASHHALDCANLGINVILFDKPWNKNVTHKNITRVKSWKEVLEIIKIL